MIDSRKHQLSGAGDFRVGAAASIVLSLILAFLVAACSQDNGPAGLPLVTVHKLATCQCCTRWLAYLKQSGFAVKVESEGAEDLARLRQQAGIPDALSACHTAFVGGYVIEGHVPAGDIHRLLAEHPQAKGLVLPGMPVGSPGMEHDSDHEPYTVLLLAGDGTTHDFAKH